MAGLRARFARYARPMSDTNLKQADVIEGAEVLPNAARHRTGPAARARDGRSLVLLPGPPGEMQPMFDEQVLPRLRARAGATHARQARVLRIAAMSESDVEQAAAPVYKTFREPAHHHPRRRRPGGAAPRRRGRRRAARPKRGSRSWRGAPRRSACPGRIYSDDGRELPEVVVDLLRERELTLALAESCTGGLLAARLTDVPGASAVPRARVVTYATRRRCERWA